jgi:hypothetical protein
MYSEDIDNAAAMERNGDDVYSRPVRAGKRTYFFDVKATKGNDYYLTITESKRRIEKDGRFAYDKHKIFLYKEDFEKFTQGLEEVIAFIKEKCPIPVVERTMEEEHRPSSRDDEGNSQFSDINFEEL